MSIISSNHRLVKVDSTEYSAGSGIDITNKIISLDPNLSAAIDNKLDTSAVGFDNDNTYVTGISGKEISASRAEYSHYATEAFLAENANNAMTAQTARFDEHGHSISSTYSSLYELSSFVNSSSGAWDEGKTYSGIAPIVVNNTTNEISADSQDISFGTGLDFTNGVLSVTAHSGDPEVESVVRTNSADWGTITALSSTSSLLDNKITAVRNDLNTVTTNTGYLHTDIQTTSGILSAAIDYVSANVGDEFPASANDAITAYQTYSGTYLTAHQDISTKLDTTAFSTVSGDFLTAVDLTPYYTTADANTLSSMFSGAVDYVSANAGTTYTGVAPIVVTGNTISADSFDLTIGSGLAFENNTLYVSAQGGDPEVESVVKTNSADWETITAYQTYSGTYLTAHQDLSNYTTTGDLNNASSTLSGAIDYVSANLPEGFTGASVNVPITGDGTTATPLGLASSFQLIDNSIYTTATYGGSVSIEGIMPRLQLKTNNSSYNTLGEGGMTVTHPASSVGGGYTTSHYGEKMSLSYNDGDYYLHTVDTTKSGLGVTYKGAPNVKAYYNYSGVALTNDNGATNEYVNVASIRNWNGVYDTVNTNSASWAGGTSLTGDAQGAVDEVYANSANWNDNYSTVNTNSGVWGGSALQISAGPGIGLNLDNNVLIISSNGAGGGGFYSESALLYQGSKSDSRTTAWTLNDNVSAYKIIQCDWVDTNNYYVSKQIPIPSGLDSDMTRAAFFDAVFEYGTDLWCKAQRFSAQNATVYAQVDEYCVHTDGTVSNVGSDVQNNRPIMVQIIGIK